jgi:hypothetical protein
MFSQRQGMYHIERKVVRMASLRQILGNRLAEQNRKRSMLRKLAHLSGMAEAEFSERLENALRQSQIRRDDFEGDRSQTDLALLFLWKVLYKPQDVAKELGELFRMPEDYFAKWPPLHAEEMLDRACKHACAGCYWQQEVVCIQSDVEENFPEECPGFKPEPPEEDSMGDHRED